MCYVHFYHQILKHTHTRVAVSKRWVIGWKIVCFSVVWVGTTLLQFIFCMFFVCRIICNFLIILTTVLLVVYFNSCLWKPGKWRLANSNTIAKNYIWVPNFQQLSALLSHLRHYHWYLIKQLILCCGSHLTVLLCSSCAILVLYLNKKDIPCCCCFLKICVLVFQTIWVCFWWYRKKHINVH